MYKIRKLYCGKSQSQKMTYYDSIYVTFLKWQDYGDREQKGVQGAEERVREGGKQMWLWKGIMKDLCVNGSFSILTASMSILLHDSFARWEIE